MARNRNRWVVLMRRDLSASEIDMCAKVYALAQDNLDWVMDRSTDELNATALLELACNEYNIEDGSDMYSLVEDLAAAIADIYEQKGTLE